MRNPIPAGRLNRRTFLKGSVAAASLLPTFTASAIDVDIAESPIMSMLRMLPDIKGADGLDFAPTSGMNHRIQREVWPENPDMYWDPLGEDYMHLLGFHPAVMNLGVAYEHTSLTSLDNSGYSDNVTLETLVNHGWEMVDEEIRLLHYVGAEQDRRALADSLHLLGGAINEGRWDWISLPDVAHLISGPNEELIRPIADRVKNFPPMTTIDTHFHGLRNILHPEAYYLSLLPPQKLPVANASAAYVSKTWLGDTPIVQSIGLRLIDADVVESTVATIEDRLATEVSPSTNTPYVDFLEISDVKIYLAAVRIDFIDSSGDWDIVQTLDQDDLGMLPPA